LATRTKNSRTSARRTRTSSLNGSKAPTSVAEEEIFLTKGWTGRTFDWIAERSARIMGTPTYFIACVVTVLIWGAWGIPAAFSDTWQLVMNTLTTVLTWLMVALLQASQNRATAGLHAKLDEIVRVLPEARDELVGAGEETER
jgi:low affinity Fe/Cu permease